MNFYMTKEQLLDAADIIDRAHDVLLHEGWWPNGEPRKKQGHCIESAINVACDEPWMVGCASRISVTSVPWYVRTLLLTKDIDYRWNDMVGRTEDEVFDRMRTVAKELRDEAGAL